MVPMSHSATPVIMQLTAEVRICGRVNTAQWMRLVKTPNKHSTTQIQPWTGAYTLN